MKKITLGQAVKIIKNCFAVAINSNILVIPYVSNIIAGKETLFLVLQWEDGNSVYTATFDSFNNQNPYINNNSELVLIDSMGYEIKLTILTKTNDFDV